MKAINIVALLASGSLIQADKVDTRAAEEACGVLGVMEAPASAYLNGGVVRQCRDHPMGSDRGLDINDDVANAPFKQAAARSSVPEALAERCKATAAWGCARGGYCWKSCGRKGEWCWTAANYGKGPWARCSSWKDCGFHDLKFACSGGCGC